MKSEQTMFQKLKQVGMTHITWRWIWLLLPLNFALILVPVFIRRNDTEALAFTFATMFGTVMPIMTCMPLFMAIAKWQFADPRARLIPGYTRPHFAAIFSALAVPRYSKHFPKACRHWVCSLFRYCWGDFFCIPYTFRLASTFYR